jgi:hypothetical protein
MTYFKKSIKENFDTMKKNVMLKIASVLMVAVLLTTCAISSTFAKYVTDGVVKTTDEARVAKWNLSIIGTPGENAPLFLNKYDTDTSFTVEGGNSAKVVAPGTKNADSAKDAFKITVTGTPEVKYQLKVVADIELKNWFVKDEISNADVHYCPLQITVTNGSGSKTFYGNDYSDDGTDLAIDLFEKAIEDYIAEAILGTDNVQYDANTNTYTRIFNPNVSVPATANGVTLSWAWDYENSKPVSDATGNPAKQTDAYDTLLGNSDKDVTIQIVKFAVSAEQLD